MYNKIKLSWFFKYTLNVYGNCNYLNEYAVTEVNLETPFAPPKKNLFLG